MTKNKITCPSCRGEIELSEIVAHQVRERMAGEIDERRKELEADYARRDGELKLRAAQVEKDQRAVEARVNEKVETERKKLEGEREKMFGEARRQAEKESALQLGDLREQIQAKETKLLEAQKAQIEYLRKERALADREKELELKLNQELNTEREKMHQQAREFALSEFNLKLADKDKHIEELRRQIEALSQRAHKTSQQMQGDVLEVEFEALLRQNFPHDEITAIKTGANGADLLQEVRTTQGMRCGKILWEVKRTATYSKQWIPKLKEDQRANGAELAAILTQSLPSDIESFGHRDGVWVTGLACGVGLASAMRQGLLQTAAARRAAEGKGEKMEWLHRYLSGTEFRHKIEGLVEGFVGLRNDLEAEKRATQRQWAKREKHLEQLVGNTAGLYGGLQGIIGAAALPEIPALSGVESAGLLEE